MSVTSPHTLIQCLTAIAQHHGLQINPERLISEYALGSQEPSDMTLLRIAAEIGLKAKTENLTCIDCHFGIAHKEPDGPGPRELFGTAAKTE